jgi:uncharacterized protein with HEPN domain
MSNKIVVANIQTFEMIGGNVASVVAETSKVETAQDYANKIRDKFEGKIEVVPGTVRNVTQIEQARAVAFHVRPVTESRPYEDASQMREVIEANVFADDEDATWKVVEAQPGVRRLVKQSDTDISALLAAAARQSVGRIAANFFDAGIGTVDQGEFALFTNPETATADSGVVSYDDNGQLNILSVKTGKLVPCSHSAVVAHSHFVAEGESDEAKETAALDKRDAQGMIAYFRKLYASQPAFFAQLEQMMRKRALIA